MNHSSDRGGEDEDAVGGSDGVEDRPGEAGDATDGGTKTDERPESVGADDGDDGEGTVAEGDPDSWSAAAPTDGDGEVPLPWTVGDEEESDEEESEETLPEAFEDLRFVGPKTAAALRDSAVGVEDLARKRVSYRDLTANGVHPGVAAKIRREHSLSWSFDSEDGDLSRRSSQVRGLDDDERAWVAASSGWAGDEPSPAETDGSGDATSTESAWRERTDGVEEAADGTSDSAAESGADPTTDAEAEWRAAAEGTGPNGPTRDEEAEWRAKSTPTDERRAESDEETAWRERATESGAATRGDADGAFPDDAEAAWRERSAPTPVTVLDGVDDDYAGRLADAGIRSVRRLATADPESVADALELDERRVREWCEAARARVD